MAARALFAGAVAGRAAGAAAAASSASASSLSSGRAAAVAAAFSRGLSSSSSSSVTATATAAAAASASSSRTSAAAAGAGAAAGGGDPYDLVVVGGGPGGYVAAIRAGQAGLKVACVEGRGKLGGTCLNVGCIPSKALLNASHKYEEALKHFSDHGITVEGVSMSVPEMQKNKQKRVDGLTSGIEGLFKKNKVDYVKGWATLTSPSSISVSPAEGAPADTPTEIKTKEVIIATGSDVMSLPGMEIDEEVVVSSTGALAFTEVPKEMVVIGGGVIGLEMGSVWQRLGSQVTVIEFADAICAGADADVAKEMQKLLKKQGMKFLMKSKVLSAKQTADGRGEVVYEPVKGGEPTTLSVDKILVAVGRKPNTEGLGLENVGIQTEKPGIIPVDDQFRTPVDGIRAIGDVIRGPMLAHKAEEEGVAAVEYITTGHGHVNYDAIPSVIYTHPEVAWVGKNEQELKAAGIEYASGKFTMKANSRARTNADDDGFVKILTEKGTDRILGAHIVAANAGELIQSLTFAIEYEASSEDVARTCHAHPTLSEAVKEAALAAHYKPIHS